jgi:hypothetical protein
MIAVAGLDHREFGHVAGDAATEEQRLAVGGDRHPPGLEHLVGEVAGDAQGPVVGERGAAVGGDHHAVLAHNRHRQRHARRSLSLEVPVDLGTNRLIVTRPTDSQGVLLRHLTVAGQA